LTAPLSPFLDEHQILWRLESELGRAIDGMRPNETARLALEIVDMLRAHIQRENEVLLPKARRLLGPNGLVAVAKRLN
jgi:hemerythrin-like domain-containing protein